MIRKFLTKIFITIFLLVSNFAQAAPNIRVISDAEIENKIRNFIAPLIRAANLNPNNISIHVIIDPSYNAFVTAGTNIFINSGLIIKFANNPNILYGVLAHEIAHIYAGHLIKLREEAENMTSVAVGGAILGIATAFAGAPDAGMFIGASALNAAQRGMMSYSREHETEADKIAIDLLYRTHNNGRGLIDFFQYMNQVEYAPDISPYMRTHPVNNERISSLQNAIKSKLGKFGDNITAENRFDFKRIATKLDAFLLLPEKAVDRYKNDAYGLSIGYFRNGQLSKAVELLDKVIVNEPSNPYLWELKGQYYFENGKFQQANQFYHKSFSALPRDKIIKIQLAIAKINLASQNKDNKLLKDAISLLNQVTNIDENNLMAYFMLSRAYGMNNEQNKAILALAEYYFFSGSYEKSRILASKVVKMSRENSKEYLRANDILQFAKDLKARGG